MSHIIDKLTFFKRETESFSEGHGVMTDESRGWEQAYRSRWQHDKIVRSTHGVNCTGSCSWKIYVKNGLVTWETQQTDYPRTRPDMPNHEPRGCSRGASYSWYLYSANRMKYPLVRSRLLKAWRAAKVIAKDPVNAWESIVSNEATRKSYQQVRGKGGFLSRQCSRLYGHQCGDDEYRDDEWQYGKDDDLLLEAYGWYPEGRNELLL